MGSLYTGGTISSIVIGATVRHGKRPFIGDGAVSWTYGEFGERVGRYITFYKSLGLGKGNALSVLSSNRAEAWAAMCAGLIIGMRYTPLHPLAAEDDQAFIIEDAEIDLLIVEGAKFAQRGAAIKARVPTLKHFMAFGAAEGLTDISQAVDGLAPAPLVDECHPDDLTMIGYTGGTTGRSKGVMLPHRAMVTMTLLMNSDWDFPADIRYLAATPVSHAAGVIIYPVMLRGGYVRLTQGFDAEVFCRLVEEERITATFLVPTLIYALIDQAELRAKYDMSSLDMIVYGAAPMSPDRLREGIAAFGNVFMQLYGQTEAPNCITTLRKVDHDLSRPERLGSCGRPCPMVEVKLLDSDLNEVGVGEPGEICVRGPLVMAGYWKRPDATAETLKGDWLHTGDVAVRDAEGFLYIVDRTKDMIISGGFNIYPREVEDALMAHAAVASAAVIGIPDDKWGEAVTAFVVLKPGAATDAAELQAHVKAARGAPWSPKSVNFVEAIPVTGLGKIDRKVLRAPYWEGRKRGVA